MKKFLVIILVVIATSTYAQKISLDTSEGLTIWADKTVEAQALNVAEYNDDVDVVTLTLANTRTAKDIASRIYMSQNLSIEYNGEQYNLEKAVVPWEGVHAFTSDSVVLDDHRLNVYVTRTSGTNLERLNDAIKATRVEVRDSGNKLRLLRREAEIDRAKNSSRDEEIIRLKERLNMINNVWVKME